MNRTNYLLVACIRKIQIKGLNMQSIQSGTLVAKILTRGRWYILVALLGLFQFGCSTQQGPALEGVWSRAIPPGGSPEGYKEFYALLQNAPLFDWPPPNPTLSTTVDRDYFASGKSDIELKQVDNVLRTNLLAGGYDQLYYYVVPGGFALVTRLEQFDSDGKPLTGTGRWSREVSAPSRRFPIKYFFETILGPPPEGRFRIFVFIVSHFDFSSSRRVLVGINELEPWVERYDARIRLPPEISDFIFTKKDYCAVLIYEYKKLKGEPLSRVGNSDMTIEQHLSNVGFGEY